MVVEAEQAAERLLKDIVPDELLAQGGCTQDDAANLLDGIELGETLIDAGRAHVQSSRLASVSPGLALQGRLADLMRRLETDQERLLRGSGG